MPPSTWIRFPSFFAIEMPPRGPLELWLQHADCGAPATGADVEVVAPGKVFMTRGWGEVARVCRMGGALILNTMAAPCCPSKSSTQKAVAWSAAPEEAVRTSTWQGLGLPHASLMAPLAAAAMLGSPATLPSSSRL